MNTKPNLILFNGPPGSGKDAAAKILAATGRGRILSTKFANVVKRGAHLSLGYDVPADAFEAIKDEPQAYLGGKTWRQVYIAFSEEFMKPLFGDRIFGTRLAQAIAEHPSPVDTVTVSDSGFKPEALALIDSEREDGYPIFDGSKITLIRLHRRGCDFTADSRSHIDLGETDIDQHDIINDGSLYDLELRLHEILGTEIMRPRLYQLQVQVPGPDGVDPQWLVFRDRVADLGDALTFAEATRRDMYRNRVVRVVLGDQIIRTAFPGDGPLIELAADLQPLCPSVAEQAVPLEDVCEPLRCDEDAEA